MATLVILLLETIFNLEVVSAETLTVLVVSAIGLVVSYGVEDALRAADKELPAIKQKLWESKRFWLAVASVLSAVLFDVLGTSGMELNLFGETMGLYDLVIVVFLSGLVGMSPEDFVQAWRRGPDIEMAVTVDSLEPAAKG